MDNHEKQKGFILGTSDPVRFPSVVKEAISISPTMPELVMKMMKKPKKAYMISAEYEAFRISVIKILKNI